MAFYERARQDETLSPIFAGIPDAAWPGHLARIHDFWTSVMHGSGRYKGNPFGAHLGIGIEPRHFERWLALFEETAAEQLRFDAAAPLIVKAHRIADSLRAGLLYRPDLAQSA
ncbi:group III truncated hemoglobin [Salinarimonas soli]|uniref:Group III truncated hemoglobin n=2 Tax=Salinarimonas soli TaxID=1638099 RepID=A0A5B2VWC0_9HYPH|nr:group III truncated hemoglobin [Salinarimonas soli]